jgi:hypothetical protein
MFGAPVNFLNKSRTLLCRQYDERMSRTRAPAVTL